MGLTGSPYQAVQTATRAKRMMLGDKDQEDNPFRWDSIELNMPGDASYDPRLPWIFKKRKDGLIAADLITYIDDNRGTGNDSDEAWAVSSKIAKCCSWLWGCKTPRESEEPQAGHQGLGQVLLFEQMERRLNEWSRKSDGIKPKQKFLGSSNNWIQPRWENQLKSHTRCWNRFVDF